MAAKQTKAPNEFVSNRAKTPQEKKVLSYQKDRRNTYGESVHGARKAIPQRKAWVNRSYRHGVRQQLTPTGELISNSIPPAKCAARIGGKPQIQGSVMWFLQSRPGGSARAFMRPHRNRAPHNRKQSTGFSRCETENNAGPRGELACVITLNAGRLGRNGNKAVPDHASSAKVLCRRHVGGGLGS
jgi:hypothetical protein